MKKILLYTITVGLSVTFGYWLNEMTRFANGVAEDARTYKPITDSVVFVSNGEQFDEFLWNFMTDSAFQFERIQFPLEAELVNADFETEFKRISKNDWKMSWLFANEEYRVQIYDNWQERLASTNQRLIVYHGVENGIRIEYYFEQISKKWFLVKFADHST